MLAAIPEGLTFEEAAPGSEGWHYAPLVDPGGQGPARPGRARLALATPPYALDGCGSRPSWVSSETWS